jgi:predicted Zn-dependent protease with MMP-like domain
MFPQLSDDHRFVFFLLMVVFFVGLFWWWNRRAKKWLEDRGRGEVLTEPVQWLAGKRRPKAKARLRYSEQEFQEMVASALDEVPEEFDKEWKNVAVIVSTDWPSEEDKERLQIGDEDLLLGTYSGVAKTAGVHSENAAHVIVIYQPALEMLCGGDKMRIERQIRKTILHELAHHLGMSHERMRKIGL